MDCAQSPNSATATSACGSKSEPPGAGRRAPLPGSMELTFQCNVCCKHCYLDSQQELTTAEWYDLLDQVDAQARQAKRPGKLPGRFFAWLGAEDLNPHIRIQSPLSYH
jgi:hypothetical protein